MTAKSEDSINHVLMEKNVVNDATCSIGNTLKRNIRQIYKGFAKKHMM